MRHELPHIQDGVGLKTLMGNESQKPSKVLKEKRCLNICLLYGAPAGTVLIAGLWQIGSRSFTQDEAATISATHRPFTHLLSMLMHIDAVHGVYYVLIHAVILGAGTSETAVRLPSALATAGAASVLTALGTRLSGRSTGLIAGLLYALSPPATIYAQTARPYALVTLLAVVASYRLVLLGERGGRLDAIYYAVALAIAGWVNVLTLLLIPAHAITMLLSPQWRRHFHQFSRAVAAAGCAVLPIALLALTQVSQVAWESPPSPASLLVLSGLLTVFGTLAFFEARRGTHHPGRRHLVLVAAPWLMAPPVILAFVSELSPMWEPRYLLFCLPAICLLGASPVTRLRTAPGFVLPAIVVVGMLAAQPLARAPATDNLRAVSLLLKRYARPGDAVVFPEIGRRLIKDAYPAGFRHLRDIGLDNSPAHRNTLYGLNVSPKVLERRLSNVRRLWVIEYTTPHPAPDYGAGENQQPFHALKIWQVPGSTVILYTRPSLSAADPPGQVSG